MEKKLDVSSTPPNSVLIQPETSRGGGGREEGAISIQLSFGKQKGLAEQDLRLNCCSPAKYSMTDCWHPCVGGCVAACHHHHHACVCVCVHMCVCVCVCTFVCVCNICLLLLYVRGITGEENEGRERRGGGGTIQKLTSSSRNFNSAHLHDHRSIIGCVMARPRCCVRNWWSTHLIWHITSDPFGSEFSNKAHPRPDCCTSILVYTCLYLSILVYTCRAAFPLSNDPLLPNCSASQVGQPIIHLGNFDALEPWAVAS